jgi:hypothetical protein
VQQEHNGNLIHSLSRPAGHAGSEPEPEYSFQFGMQLLTLHGDPVEHFIVFPRTHPCFAREYTRGKTEYDVNRIGHPAQPRTPMLHFQTDLLPITSVG